MSNEYLLEEEKRRNTNVYCYTVFWKENFNLTSAMWYQKPFASKKNAKDFAKKHKNKEIKLKPYILKTIVYGDYFRKDVEVEIAHGHGDRYGYVEVIKV